MQGTNSSGSAAVWRASWTSRGGNAHNQMKTRNDINSNAWATHANSGREGRKNIGGVPIDGDSKWSSASQWPDNGQHFVEFAAGNAVLDGELARSIAQ
jgi:hypothetical protein